MLALDLTALLKQASIHFTLGLFIGFCIAWILVSKVKRENHTEMLEIIKQKNDIIKQKDDDIDRQNKQCEKQAEIFSKAIVTKDAIIATLQAKLDSYESTKEKAQRQKSV